MRRMCVSAYLVFYGYSHRPQFLADLSQTCRVASLQPIPSGCMVNSWEWTTPSTAVASANILIIFHEIDAVKKDGDIT